MPKKHIIILLTLLIILSTTSSLGIEESNAFDARAVVLEVKEDKSLEGFDIQFVKLKILSGKYKNKIVETENSFSGNIVYDIPVEKGDKVVVFIEEIDGNLQVYITDYSRDTYIYYLLVIFIMTLIAVGKNNGVKTIITLLLTFLSIFKILLPLILKGLNPIPITILISTTITILTLLIISGFNKKSFSAIIGTISGVIIAGLLAFIIGTKVKLTGLSSEEATMLLYIPQNIDFNFKDLLFSGILLGALGAVMDVSMSISSSIDEINKVNPNLSSKELFVSGMNVGKDIMGTMSNTLILAYTGSSVPLILLFMAYDTSLIKIMNLDIVATEIIRSLAGSIGLILTIPITSFVATYLQKISK